MTKKKEATQPRLPGVIDEIEDIKKIIAEGRDGVQTDIGSLKTKIQNCEDLIEVKREKEKELNDALRKLDHLQTLKDKLKKMIQKEAEKKEKKEKKKK